MGVEPHVGQAQVLIETQLWHIQLTIKYELSQVGFFPFPDPFIDTAIILSYLVCQGFSLRTFYDVVLEVYHSLSLLSLCTILQRVVMVSKLGPDRVIEALVDGGSLLEVGIFDLEDLEDARCQFINYPQVTQVD
jgi:hypothetical protein